MLLLLTIQLAIISLGYVGLPLAVEFGKKRFVMGFDINQSHIDALKAGHGITLEVSDKERAQATALTFTHRLENLKNCNVYIVIVPSSTNELKQPERINPGDKEYRVTNIKKFTAGSTPETADVVDALYNEIIIVDTHKEQSIGYQPEIILSGRRLNDKMGQYVVGQLVKAMLKRCIMVQGARVLIMGLSFKENCPDLRNTRVVDMVKELQDYNVDVDVFDPWVNPNEAQHEYGIHPVTQLVPNTYDAIILAVSHDEFKTMGEEKIRALGKEQHVLSWLPIIV